MKLQEICEKIAVEAFEIGDIIESSIPNNMCSKLFKVVNKKEWNISVEAVSKALETTGFPGWLGGSHRPTHFFKPENL